MTTLEQDPLHPEHDRRMPLTEHLRELRRRILTVLVVMGVVLVVTWSFSDRVVWFIERPVLPYAQHLQFDTLTDPFFSHFKAALYASVFFTFPLMLFQLWRFVAPGLYKHERSWALPFLLLSFPLFVGGALFCYTVVYPAAVSYLIQFDPTLVPSLRLGDYLSFTLSLMFIFGMVFEMPLITLLLTRIGILTPEFLTRNRRYAIVLIFLAAGIITPTPDAFTQCMLAGPMLILFEVSVLVSRMARRRKPAEAEAEAGGAPAGAEAKPAATDKPDAP